MEKLRNILLFYQTYEGERELLREAVGKKLTLGRPLGEYIRETNVGHILQERRKKLLKVRE